MNKNNDLNILNTYLDENIEIVSRSLKINKDKSKELVKSVMKETIDEPDVKYYGRTQYGDRVERKTKITKYFNNSRMGIITPSCTVYHQHSKKMSIHSKNTTKRVALRSVCKKEAFVAEQTGQMDLYNIKETQQKTYKTANNGFTGLTDNKYNPHYCPSIHYSLTSITATVTSIGNSLGESMVAGNRIYTRPEVVLNHISSIMNNGNDIKPLIEKYNLYIPTVDDCFYVILKSTRFYWSSTEKELEIRELLELLTDDERCAFVYINDLFHFKYFNKDLMRDLLTGLMTKSNDCIDPLKEIKDIPEDIEIAAKSILYDEMKVHSINEESINFKDDKFIETKKLIVGTSKNIKRILEKHDDLIASMFRTNHLPINVADIKQVVRKCTILSDTDSTCSTYQHWVQWYFKRQTPNFKAEEIGLSGLVLLFNVRTLAHSLEMFSTRMNIQKPYTKILAMKNEFYWNIMIFMNKTKHYFADTAIREGNVFKKTKLELKGSNLIDSKLPKDIKELSDSYFIKINKMMTDGKKIDMDKLINEIADIERDVIKRIKNLDTDILKSENIKDHNSYAGGKTGSAYYHVMLWNAVFGEKYGMITTLPIDTIKVKTCMDTKARMIEAINEIKNESIRSKFKEFLGKYPKDRLETLRLPKQFLNDGIPEEIEHMVVIDRTVEELCNTFYLLLSSLGYYKKEGILLSNYYK